MSTPLLIVGAGGFALEAIWIAQAMNATGQADWELIGLADDRVAAGEIVGGLTVLGKPRELAPTLNCAHFHIPIGDNRARLTLANDLQALGLMPATLISGSAQVAPDAVIGPGCFIGHLAYIGPQAMLGAQTVVNVQAVVGHESRVGAGAQLCPGAVCAGRCRMGEGAFLGSNAVMQPGIAIGDWAKVSANTFAASDVEAGVTLAVMPGRPVFARKPKPPADA